MARPVYIRLSKNGKVETMANGYIEIAGGYSYAPLRVGLVLRNPDGAEIYCQPGDDENAMRENIDALEEVEESKRAIIADMTFSDYFSN